MYGADTPAVRLDYDDPSTWPSVLDGATTLFLLFPLPSPRRAKRQMAPFVEAAGRAGVKHFVYTTVPGADTSKKIPHYHVERAIEATGAGHTFLRASYFMQNLVRALSTHGVDIATNDQPYIPAKVSVTIFVDSRDVGEVALKVTDDPGAHLNASYTLDSSAAAPETFGSSRRTTRGVGRLRPGPDGSSSC